jgi:hypothetical protein
MDSDSSSNIDTLSRFVEQYHLRRHSEPSADQNLLLVSAREHRYGLTGVTRPDGQLAQPAMDLK